MAKFTDRFKTTKQKAVTTGTGGTVKSGTGSTVTSRDFSKAAPTATKAPARKATQSAPKAPSSGPKTRPVVVGRNRVEPAGRPPRRGGKRRVKPTMPEPTNMSTKSPSRLVAPSRSSKSGVSPKAKDPNPFRHQPSKPARPPVGAGIKPMKSPPANNQNLGAVARDLGFILGIGTGKKRKKK